MSTLDIAFVTETYPPEVNGVAMAVGRLVGGLRELGHRVSVIRPRHGKSDAGGEHELALPGLPLPGYPGLRFGLPAGGRLARQWRQRRPDLVRVVTEGPLGWSAVTTARRLGIPVTSGFHTNFDRYSVHYGVGGGQTGGQPCRRSRGAGGRGHDGNARRRPAGSDRRRSTGRRKCGRRCYPS